MCIICVSPKGAPQPTHDHIRRIGTVQTHKGFTDLQEGV
jgi:hypothetical protein